MADPYPSLEKLERRRYPPYGSCIYCDALEGLTTEHIVPFGLGGTLELPDASCLRCATETSRVERAILRGELRPVRVFRALQSRRKHKDAPSTYPLAVVRDGVEVTVELPLDSYPILVPFPDFAPARLATGQPSKPGIDVAGIATVSFGADPASVLRDLGASAIKPSVSTHPAQFARMVAKIAFAMAAATGALSLIKGRKQGSEWTFPSNSGNCGAGPYFLASGPSFGTSCMTSKASRTRRFGLSLSARDCSMSRCGSTLRRGG